ncbi:MAG TPA: hypothetical protein VE954_36360 [Oligoflexus sp.]|uniref:hypothetical protein n=1 Tax=Oligoflexus sp. TaxID=1971216 RepID=UPI002D6E0064|nr:hypothetical protein [Oligoflexus sp.]HYX38609.1 hypothetical protein [Oligoflexus sp.]
MDKFAKGIAYLFIGLAAAVYICGAASFFLPETSNPSIIFEKLKFLAMAFFAFGWVIVLQIENKKLREGMRK